MKVKSLIPMLRTKDIKATIDFYTNVLGFTCKNYVEDWEWASLEVDGFEMMLAAPNAHEPFDNASFTGSFYLTVDHVDQYWEKLKDKARVCYPIENFDYGMREFAVYDNNGYLLQFGQPVSE